MVLSLARASIVHLGRGTLTLVTDCFGWSVSRSTVVAWSEWRGPRGTDGVSDTGLESREDRSVDCENGEDGWGAECVVCSVHHATLRGQANPTQSRSRFAGQVRWLQGGQAGGFGCEGSRVDEW